MTQHEYDLMQSKVKQYKALKDFKDALERFIENVSKGTIQLCITSNSNDHEFKQGLRATSFESAWTEHLRVILVEHARSEIGNLNRAMEDLR
jgi:phage gp36-like protein